MDFELTEDQLDLQGLCRSIHDKLIDHQRLQEVEADRDRVDYRLWKALAEADVLGVGLPEALGGVGGGLLEASLVCYEHGRVAARVPFLWSIAVAAAAIAEFGSPQQRGRLLPELSSGDSIATVALVESATDTSATMQAVRQHGAWRLDGSKICVPAGHVAKRVLVPAAIDDSAVGVFILDSSRDGVNMTRQETTALEIQANLELDGVELSDDDMLGDLDTGPHVKDWLEQRAVAVLCATQVGVCEEALQMATNYTMHRRQFERELTAFQAVRQRLADAYIDNQAIRLTAWQAIWRLAHNYPAAAELAVAKYWASEAGQRVVHAAFHLHGGIASDMDYPLHRYFLMAKQVELSLGSASPQLARLGNLLAKSLQHD